LQGGIAIGRSDRCLKPIPLIKILVREEQHGAGNLRQEPFTMPDLVGGNFRRPVHTLAHRDLKYLSAGEASLHAGLVISKQDVERAACNV
jgi:hypothetical protein